MSKPENNLQPEANILEFIDNGLLGLVDPNGVGPVTILCRQ